MQNAKVQDKTKLCIFAFNYYPLISHEGVRKNV